MERERERDQEGQGGQVYVSENGIDILRGQVRPAAVPAFEMQSSRTDV